ncbi:NAD(P)-dependent oxidoreductase [Halorarius litoreus]|uniref:NAD(P)-dependent oxidoreductase n=1 Tax=Halorarius litoreus TaxID=2962676 RepID=UPI0020CE50AB|nr:hydroxyacid dehydrogenase [Halorarius litoreus]
MTRALIDRDITPAALLQDRLGDRMTATVGASASEADLVAELADVDVLFCTSRLPLTERVFAATDLAAVAKFGTGLDTVDLDAAERHGVPVTYTPGVNAAAVAEHTVSLVLAVRRRLLEHERVLRDGGWRDDVTLGHGLYGATVGIVGFGNVGRRVAAFLAGFQPELLAYDPYVDAIDTETTGTTLVDLDDLLSRSDVVTINAELTDETAGLIGERELALLPPDAVLVNTARGGIVDEAALGDALRAGDLAGAGLDVFETEPLPPSSPLFEVETVVATPHAAGATWESRERIIELLADNALALVEGRSVPDRFLAVPPA